ncbi:hypothetical protein JXA02_11045 [candidate division KSB1 bacterium]|nr:hypothetical protein [candidate division KSB1 bacterium]RQW02826.1 MAG: hypothetical protein EH222_13145 [candidate division KSB1 bacterium]
MSDKPSEGNYTTSASPQQHELAFASEISTSTLVKLLVHKGILSPGEILETERQMRLKKFTVDEKLNLHQETGQKKHARLKKWASKKRWSRRLTARLFGWEWKRTKISTANDAGE